MLLGQAVPSEEPGRCEAGALFLLPMLWVWAVLEALLLFWYLTCPQSLLQVPKPLHRPCSGSWESFGASNHIFSPGELDPFWGWSAGTWKWSPPVAAALLLCSAEQVEPRLANLLTHSRSAWWGFTAQALVFHLLRTKAKCIKRRREETSPRRKEAINTAWKCGMMGDPSTDSIPVSAGLVPAATWGPFPCQTARTLPYLPQQDEGLCASPCLDPWLPRAAFPTEGWVTWTAYAEWP